MRRLAWAMLLLAAMVAAGAAPAQTRALHVMTWNIAAGHGDLPQIARVIRDAAPDVAALQEVDVHWDARSGFADQAARLAEATGMQVRFGPIYQLPGSGDSAPTREFGVAILSRYPIVDSRNHVIPRLSTQSIATEPQPMPGFLEVAIDAGGARVRALQVSATLDLIAGLREPAILAGDLNAPPAAPELAPLFRRLKDVWSAGDGFTYPAAAPVRRIDYVLVSDAFQVREARTLPVSSSDHRPVIAELTLTR